MLATHRVSLSKVLYRCAVLPVGTRCAAQVFTKLSQERAVHTKREKQFIATIEALEEENATFRAELSTFKADGIQSVRGHTHVLSCPKPTSTTGRARACLPSRLADAVA